MIKNIVLAVTLIAASGACSSVQAQKTKQGTTSTAKTDVKFLDNITIEPSPVSVTVSDPKAEFTESQFTLKKTMIAPDSSLSIETANRIQFKYAQLLDMEVEQVKNLVLFNLVDYWLGTRYRLGGSSKEGIDCSALMQVLFSSLYGISLPRTAREQYGFSRRISLADIREGDLVFFNTIGGVSHVGMYLQNNKFVHASSGGVTISDLYEDYWMHHLIGVRRVDAPQQSTALLGKP